MSWREREGEREREREREREGERWVLTVIVLGTRLDDRSSSPLEICLQLDLHYFPWEKHKSIDSPSSKGYIVSQMVWTNTFSHTIQNVDLLALSNKYK